MKLALVYMGPFTFSSLRFISGSLTMLFVIWVVKPDLPSKHDWKHLIIVGILQTSVVFLIVMHGLRFVDAGKSSVLLYSMPIWSSLLASKFLQEKVTLTKLFGLITGMIGLLTILGWDIWSKQSIDVIVGECLIIIGAISWAIANIYYRRTLNHVSLIQASTWQMVFGTIGMIFVTLFMEWGEPVTFNIKSIFYILFTGVFGSALCFTAWFLILRLIDMVTATLSTLLVPIFGLLFSFMILDEKLSLSILVGTALIITGIVMAQIPNKLN